MPAHSSGMTPRQHHDQAKKRASAQAHWSESKPWPARESPGAAPVSSPVPGLDLRLPSQPWCWEPSDKFLRKGFWPARLCPAFRINRPARISPARPCFQRNDFGPTCCKPQRLRLIFPVFADRTPGPVAPRLCRANPDAPAKIFRTASAPRQICFHHTTPSRPEAAPARRRWCPDIQPRISGGKPRILSKSSIKLGLNSKLLAKRDFGVKRHNI